MKIIKAVLLVVLIIIFTFVAYVIYTQILIDRQRSIDEPSYPIYPITFDTVEHAPIDPATILDTIRSGKELVLQIHPDIPENPSFLDPQPFLMQVNWSQSDFLEIAQALQKAVWQDDPKKWHLIRADFHTTCANASGKFRYARFDYYQDVTKDGERLYAMRVIEIDPEYGYLDWGEDTLFHPNLHYGAWTAINLEDITKVPAEKALALADQQQGNNFRHSVENCNITVSIWPWGNERSDWSVLYSGHDSVWVWIPTDK